MNDYVIFRIDSNYEFEFVGLNVKNEKDDLDQAVQEVKNFKTVNEIRAEHDLDAIPPIDSVKSLGDILLDPGWIQQFGAQQMAQQQQQMAESQMGQQQENEEEEDSDESAPPVAGPEEQEKQDIPSDEDLEGMDTDKLNNVLSQLQGVKKEGKEKKSKKEIKKSLTLEL